MKKKQTEADFDGMSWHDCHILGLQFRVGDSEAGDWTNDIVLDIDFIVGGKCGIEGRCQFLVAPATLAFHGVTDPRINIDWGNSGFQTSIYGVSVDRIERERIQNQKVHLDRPYYKWRIVLNSPRNGEISFGAVGFTQTLLAKAVKTKEQHLWVKERDRLTNASTVARKRTNSARR